MKKAIEIANYIIYLLGDVCDDLTNMKINKLLYYVQGVSLSRTNERIFEEDIEAWEHGPVVKSVYVHYTKWPPKTAFKVCEPDIDISFQEKKDIVMDVCREYGLLTASALRDKTHDKGSPWEKNFSGANGTVIPISDIAEYFKNIAPPIKPIETYFEDMEIIDQRNKDGIIVLPEEWND